jgi:hypothetical protein
MVCSRSLFGGSVKHGEFVEFEKPRFSWEIPPRRASLLWNEGTEEA